MGEFFVNDRTRRDLGFDDLLQALAARTVSDPGQACARALPFCPDRDAVQASLERVAEARALLARRDTVPLTAGSDVSSLLQRASKGAVLSPSELLACATLLTAATSVRRFVAARRETLPLLWRLASHLAEDATLAADIAAAIEPSGLVRDSASDELADLRERSRRLHRELKQRVEVYLHDPDFAPNLQDNFFSVRGDRYVLPINASFRNKVQGIVHNASQSGHTLFIEPQELVPLGNELAINASLLAEEERRILALFSHEVGAAAADLMAAQARLAELDVVCAAARLADDMQAVGPVLSEATGSLELRHLRHPRLLLQHAAVVPNRVALDAGQFGLVVSGPNAGGKTATLTGVGLCALMVRAGLPIPVGEGSRMPLFAGVRCAIGDAQDLALGLSTFSAHLQQLRETLQAARGGWLVLIDEIAADTDPHEGAALARATLEELADQRAQVLVTTHLEEVKAMGVTDARFVNARVGYDPDSLQPTYRLETGAAGVSNALAVAAAMGVPAAVLQRAREHLQGSGLLSQALARLGALEDEARQAREATRLEHESVVAQRQALETATAEARTAQSTAEQAVRAEMAAEVEATRARLKAWVAELQARPTMRRAQAMTQQVDGELARLRKAAEPRQLEPAAAPNLRPGMWVEVPSLGQQGEVAQVDGTSAWVTVGGLRLRFKRQELRPAPRVRDKASRHFPGDHKRAPASVAAAAPSLPTARCDVRGLRGDDAIRHLERFLDDAYAGGSGPLWVVHGVGTGALQAMVREFLRRSPYVVGFRPAAAQEGGDGVTIVEIGG